MRMKISLRSVKILKNHSSWLYYFVDTELYRLNEFSQNVWAEWENVKG